MKTLLMVLVLVAGMIGPAGAQEEFKITILRTHSDSNLTYGALGVNGVNIGNTYERADKHLKPGTYPGYMRYVSANGNVAGPFGTIGQEGDFYLEIGNAEFSNGASGTNVLFHGGNKKEHSKGCVMLGAVPRDANGNRYLPADHTLSKLRKAFYGTDNPNSSPNKKIIIEVEGD